MHRYVPIIYKKKRVLTQESHKHCPLEPMCNNVPQDEVPVQKCMNMGTNVQYNIL